MIDDPLDEVLECWCEQDLRLGLSGSVVSGRLVGGIRSGRCGSDNRCRSLRDGFGRLRGGPACTQCGNTRRARRQGDALEKLPAVQIVIAL